MAIVSGAVTGRRFKVVGRVPEGWRETYRVQLEKMAFREPPTSSHEKIELEGWVETGNLLDTRFDDLDTWVHGEFAVFALRVDKKTLPAKLFRATVDKTCREWAESQGLEKVPARKKAEIKEALESEWLRRTLPRVQTTEVAWNVREGWAVVGALSVGTLDKVRTRFHRTFGLALHTWSPVDWVPGDLADALVSTAPTDFGGAS